MPRKPNYRFERSERDRAKAAKKAAKAAKAEEKKDGGDELAAEADDRKPEND